MPVLQTQDNRGPRERAGQTVKSLDDALSSACVRSERYSCWLRRERFVRKEGHRYQPALLFVSSKQVQSLA